MAQKRVRPPAAGPRPVTRRGKAPPPKHAAAGNTLRSVSRALRAYALSFPEATEDFPWGERVAKVNGKVFVFLGADPVPGGGMGLSVKLPSSGEEALELPFAEPTGYGLGKSGWVTARFGPDDTPPVEVLESWILESYRVVAPRKLVAQLDDHK